MSKVIYTENKDAQMDDERKKKVKILAIVTFFAQTINLAWNFLLVFILFGLPAAFLKERFGYNVRIEYFAVVNIILFLVFAVVTIRFYKNKILVRLNVLFLVASVLLGAFIGFGDPLI